MWPTPKIQRLKKLIPSIVSTVSTYDDAQVGSFKHYIKTGENFIENPDIYEKKFQVWNWMSFGKHYNVLKHIYIYTKVKKPKTRCVGAKIKQ